MSTLSFKRVEKKYRNKENGRRSDRPYGCSKRNS